MVKTPRDESHAQLMSAGSQEDELADRQPRVRCRGKEMPGGGLEECGKHQGRQKNGGRVSALERAEQLQEPWAGDAGSLASPLTCRVVPGKSLSYSEL